METIGRRVGVLTYAGVLILVLLWIVGIVSDPLLQASPAGHSTLASLLHYAYGRVCHQIGERSFHLGGQALGVCARCFGIYIGYLLGLLAYPFARSLTNTELPDRSWLIAALVPVAIDFAGGYLGIFENSLASRAITGSIAGVAGTFYTLPGLLSLAASLFKQNSKECCAAAESDGVAQANVARA